MRQDFPKNHRSDRIILQILCSKKSLKKVTYEKLLSLIKDNAPISKKALEYAKDKKILFSIGKNFFKATKVG